MAAKRSGIIHQLESPQISGFDEHVLCMITSLPHAVPPPHLVCNNDYLVGLTSIDGNYGRSPLDYSHSERQ